MSDEPKRYLTPRGFDVYDEVTTSNGHTVRVQQSSAAMEAHVWLFVGDSPVTDSHHPHLTVAQAIRVRDALTVFIDEESREGVTEVVCKCGQILCICGE